MSWGDKAWQVWQRFEDRPRVGTLGEVTPAWLGVRGSTEEAYLPRGVDEGLEDRLGSRAQLVVIAGDPAAGTSRTAARAAHRMLGGRRVVAPADTACADLAWLVEEARRRRAAVLWLDGAPLGVLDQVTPSLLVAARRAGVRIVVTTRSALLAADHPHEETADLLRSATGPALEALTDAEAGAGPHRAGRVVSYRALDGTAATAFLDPIGWSSLVPQAVARVAATWELLGVPHALTAERLATLVPGALGEIGAPPAADHDVHAVIRRCARERVAGLPVLTASRRGGETHLRPHPLLRTATTRTPALAMLLGPLLDETQRHAVARAALLLGDDATAARLLQGLEARGIGPAHAARVGEALGRTPSAASWFRLALAGEPDGQTRRSAQAGLGAILDAFAERSGRPWHDRDEAHRLMTAAVPHQGALLWLGERALASYRQGPTVAREWWQRAAAGPDVGLAGFGAWRVAELDVAAGRDEEAVPYLEQALDAGVGDPVEVALALGRARRRLGRHAEAEAVLRARLPESAGGVDHPDGAGAAGDHDRPERVATVLVELGLVAEARGDDDAAMRCYEQIGWHDEAWLRMAELDLRAGRLGAVRQRIDDTRRARPPFGGRRDAPWLELDLENDRHRGWASWLAGEAAYQQDDLEHAQRWFSRVVVAPGDLVDRAEMRLAQIAELRAGEPEVPRQRWSYVSARHD